jgi:hypothetical protein
MREKLVFTAEGRLVPPASSSRWCARNDCLRATCFYAIGDAISGDDAVDLAIGMLRVAWKLDALRGESTTAS